MKSTSLFAVLALSLVGAGAWALAPGATSSEEQDAALVQAQTEARLRQVFQGLLRAEQQGARPQTAALR
jgi:hypothetical protein